MDAAQTNLKKTALLLAIALLFLAPTYAAAQSLQASASSVSIGNATCNDSQILTITSSTSTPIQFTVQVQYQDGLVYGDWLQAAINGSATSDPSFLITSTTGTGGVSLTISLARTFAATSDTAHVVLTDTGNSSDTISIPVYYQPSNTCGSNTGSQNNGVISVSPASVALTATQTSQVLSIQNATASNTLSFTVTTTQQNGTWLTSTNPGTLAPGATTSITLNAIAANATSTGTLSGSVTIQAYVGTNPLGTPVVVPVTFTTSGGGNTGSTGTLTLNGATSTTYNATFQYTAPNLPGAICVPLQDSASSAGSYSYSASTTSGGSWLLANYFTSGTVTGSIVTGTNQCVTVSLSSSVTPTLGTGVYSGAITLTSSSGSVATINVALYVSAGTAPGITVLPSAIFSFSNVALNANVSQQQTFTITASNNVGLGVASITTAASWLTMSTPTIANGQETFVVTANSTGLTAGIYYGVITMTSSAGNTGYAGGTTYINVILPVAQPGTTCTSCGGTVTSVVAPLSLSFQQQAGSSYWTSGNEAQNVTITGAQGTTWSAAINYVTGSNWLHVDSPSSQTGTFGSGPATLTLDLFNGVTNLAASSTPYTATVTITTPSGTSTVNVSLLVTSSTTPVLLGLPASTNFAATTGTNPASQTVTIVGSDNTGSSSSPTISAGVPSQTWLTATTSGNKLTLAVSQTGLATGIYSATVAVTANIPGTSTAYTTIQYPVVLVVNGGGSGTGPLTLNPPSLSFTNVTSSVSSSFAATATASTAFTIASSESSCTGQTWLSVNPVGNQTSSSLSVTVTVSPAGIASGTTCTGIITLTSSGATQTEPVSMTVGGSTGSGNVTASSTSLTFPYTQGQSVPAAQTVTIVNATSGTPSIAFTVSIQEASGTSVAWLQTSVTSASTPYNSPGLSISVAPGSLSPGQYTGTVTITPTGGTAVPISVTLNITGSAVVTASPTTLSMTYTVGAASPTSTIQVSGGGSAAGFTATATSTGGWLVVSPTSGTTPNTGTTALTVSIASSQLASLLPSGSPYTGTIAIVGTSPATGTTNVQVTLTVTAPLPVISGVDNGASYASGAISPGELISIFAPTNSNNPIGPSTAQSLANGCSGAACTAAPTTMGGVQVKFLPSGLLAPITFVNAGQINAIVPYGVAGQVNLSVEVIYLGQTSNAFTLTLAATAPGIFTQNSSGTGPGAIEQYDASGTYKGINGVNGSAQKGGTLVIFMTGEGVVQPKPADGSVTVVSNTTPITPVPVYAPTVLIGNQPATVTFYGEAPGLVSGVLQVNATIPQSVASGTQTVVVNVGPNSTQANVTVTIQ